MEVKIGKCIIRKYRILGTQCEVIDAWEPAKNMERHSTFTTFCGKLYGRIGTAPDKTKYAQLEVGSVERTNAVADAYEDEYARAYKLIFEAFPVTKKSGLCDMGEVRIEAHAV